MKQSYLLRDISALMANPIISVDAFKFIALRPAQLALDRDTRVSVMEDERARTDAGRVAFAQLARSLRSGEASQRLAADAKRLSPLIDAYRAIRDFYDVTASSGGSDFVATLGELGVPVPDERQAREHTELAWDAVYAAYFSGPDAGPRLEGPVAALRLLHTLRLAMAGLLDTRAAVGDSLSATPVIVMQAMESFRLGTSAEGVPTATSAAAAPAETASRRFEGLLEDIEATQRLLAAARSSRSTSSPAVQATDRRSGSCPGEGATPHRADVVVGNVPRLRAAVASRPAESDVRVLATLGVSDETSVPIAIRSLEGHLTGLNRQAYGLRDEPAFLAAARKSGNLQLLRILPPAYATAGGLIDGGIYLPKIPRSTADVDVRGRIRPLGIGDLKVVKQTLLSYVPDEVAHIENVLKGESKERKHRALDRTETLFLSAEEETQESGRDTQTTDRFELKREAEQTIKEDMSVKAGLTVTGGFGPVTITAQGDFAYSTSKQESAKSSANFAREVVDRSVSKIQKKVKTERSTKNVREVEETNMLGIVNTTGGGHITGVYRWVDKKYRAQVYNYGVRMMIEFIVPEPAAYFRASLPAATSVAVDARPPEPFRDQSGDPLTPSDVDPTNYQLFAARYNAAGVAPPPPEYIYVGTAFEQSGIQPGLTFSKSVKDVVIPDGYIWDHFSATVSILSQNHPQFSLQIAGEIFYVLNNNQQVQSASAGYGVYWGGDWEDDPRGIVPVSAIGYDINAYAVHVEVTCRRTQEHYEKWQLTAFDKIYTAYRASQAEYDQKVAQARAGAIIIEGRNPAMNRDIEKRELKKLCITLLITGKHFNDFDAMVHPTPPSKDLPEVDVYEALAEGPTIQFFEQAFDWEQLTYLFYPYFWAQKARWLSTSNLNDPDPLFAHFLQAGAARVVVPVPLAYKDAVLYFLETGNVWQGGETPRLNDPLFISIHEETRNRTDDLAGATPEDEPWEFTIPTTLVWLQAGPELPVFGP